MQQRRKTRRGGYDGRPRQGFYPMWGIEDPYEYTNIADLYRHNEAKLMYRYIVPPSDVIDKRRAKRGKATLGDTAYKLLRQGIAVEDLVIVLIVAAGMFLMTSVIAGPDMDACMDKLGW